MRLNLTLCVATALLLSACATTYDPVEVCSAKWIEPRVERAIGYIERDTKNIIKALSKSAESFEQGKAPGPFQLIALSSAVNKLTKELKTGRGVKDLRILRDTCDDPQIIEDALTDYMTDQGLPAGMISFIKALQPYQDLIENEFTRKPGTA